MRGLVWIVVLLVLGALAYIRLAPSDPARWHRDVTPIAPGDRRDLGGFKAARELAAPADEVMEAAREAMLKTSRTRVLAGSVEEGRITFVTRSAVFGFPDYTTVEVEKGLLLVHARLRFGKGDMGVNAARVQHLLDELDPLIVAPQAGNSGA